MTSQEVEQVRQMSLRMRAESRDSLVIGLIIGFALGWAFFN